MKDAVIKSEGENLKGNKMHLMLVSLKIKKDIKSQLLEYIKICNIEVFFKINTIRMKFEEYF